MLTRYCRSPSSTFAVRARALAAVVALLSASWGTPSAKAQLNAPPTAMIPATEIARPSATDATTFAPPAASAAPTVMDSYVEPVVAIEAEGIFAGPGTRIRDSHPAGVRAMTPEGEPFDYGVGDGSAYGAAGGWEPEAWTAQFFPNGLIYRSYLAGTKEPRFGVQVFKERNDGWLWDIALGGRVGLLRYGTARVERPEGFQVDMEGAAFPRLDPESQMDLNAADFRFGIPFTYGVGPWQVKFAYYHISSHVGDEYLLRNGLTTRFNYARDALVLGGSYFVTPAVRLYAEADWAFYQDVSRPWAFQFGAEYSPPGATGPRGTPFLAVNGHLRQELDYSGHVVAQAGWQWRSPAGHLMRIGAHYHNGLSNQFEFFNDFEEQIGAGLWYDY